MKYLFLVAALFTASFLFGQNPTKKYPIKSPNSIFHERKMIFNSKFNEDKWIKTSLVDSKTLTETQLNTAFKYSNFSEYPEALNTIDKLLKMDSKKIWDYKTYWIGSWTEFFPAIENFRQIDLIWIPKEENLHMEAEYIPKTENGFYVVVGALDDDEVPFFPAPSPVVKSIVKKLDSKKMDAAKKLSNLYDITMPGYGHALGGFYSVLRSKFGLTDDEIEAISRSAAIDGWPDSLKLTKRKDLAFEKLNDYNYFKLGEFIGEYGINTLYWVPSGQVFANGFLPKSDLGFFFVVRVDESQKRAIPEKEDLAYLNSAWWLKNISSTQSYKPATFSFGSSSATIASSSNSSSSNSSGNNGGFSTTTTVNGITIATANLERKNKRSGVMILYFGSNRIVSNVSLFVVEIDKNNSEDGIAESLQRRVAGSSPYMYFEFKEGFDCSNAQGYLRKKGISPPSCIY